MVLFDDARSTWNARDNRAPRPVSAATRTGVSWHYVGPDIGLLGKEHQECLNRVKGFQDYHMDTHGWDDIGYNALVCVHARVIEGRGFDLIAAHSPTVNDVHYGVEFMVGETESPTAAMYARAEALKAELEAHSGHSLRQWGHKDDPATTTACPGTEIYNWVKTLIPGENMAYCPRSTWRGVTVCTHSVPFLDAWAKACGADIYLKPLKGCGAWQALGGNVTSASAGTHDFGGAIDVDLNGLTSSQKDYVMNQGRAYYGLVWRRDAISGLWTNHGHALDPRCPNMARSANAQFVLFRQGYNGLVGNGPDVGSRINTNSIMSLWDNRVANAVNGVWKGILDVGTSVGSALTVTYLQAAVHQTKDGVWGEETDIDLRNTRAAAKNRNYFKDYRWTLDQKKRMQRSWGTTQDGIWGPATDAALTATIKKIQDALDCGVDGSWGYVTDTDFLTTRKSFYKGQSGLPAFISLTKPVAKPPVAVKPVDFNYPFTRGGPANFFPYPGKVGASYYGPSTPNRPWYSGKSAGGTTRPATWMSGGLPLADIRSRIMKIQRLVGAGVDGSYGDKTTAAVKAWQAKNKLTADGIVGPKTWQAMAKSKGQ